MPPTDAMRSAREDTRDGVPVRNPEGAELIIGGHAYPLGGAGPWSIGRAPSNAVVISDPQLSRRHARISRCEGGGFQIEDLFSTNGTELDGELVEKAGLEDGAKLRFGGVTASFAAVRAEDPRPARGARLPYLPGLDGLRAFAVLAVLLYHAGVAWIPGGFLGVEVFFVISGYLITGLLLAEWKVHGRIDFKQFWLRRARRLLPALFLLLLVVLTFSAIFLPRELAGLRNDAIAAFTYVTNWYLIFTDESYFQAVGRPSLLKHLWSLAIEEQFYVFWPLILTAGLMFWRKWRMLGAILAGAALSAVLMGVLYHPGQDPSRVYYGTDTRAAGLLIGAALAFVWMPSQVPNAPEGKIPTREGQRRINLLRRRFGWAWPVLLDLAGLAALGALVFFYLRLGEGDDILYRGGMTTVGLATGLLILAVVHPYTRLAGGLLAWGPLRWIGVRSYGIYLWHWPIFMVTRPDLDVPLNGLPLLALRFGLTIAVAALSYRFVETPIRTGALGRAWRRLRESSGPQRRRLVLGWTGATTVVAVFAVFLGVAMVRAEEPPPPSYLANMKAIHSVKSPSNGNAPDGATQNEADKSQDSQPQAATQDELQAEKSSKADPQTTPANGASDGAADDASEPAQTGPVTAIGDSVMLGAAQGVQKEIPNLQTMDAQVGLQVEDAIAILQQRAAAGQLGDIVVVHLGTNGTFTREQFDRIMAILGDDRRVVFVNLKVPRSWEASNNAVIRDGVERYDNAVLADWNAASADHPGYFYADGMHPDPKGVKVYSKLIASRLSD